jgi:hypothetical protein
MKKAMFSSGNTHYNSDSFEERPPKWLIELRERLEKGFGDKNDCRTFAYGCARCMAWLAYDILYDLYGIVENRQTKKL